MRRKTHRPKQVIKKLRETDGTLPALLDNDANTDTLLVEVDADELHDKLLVWKPVVF